MEILTFLRKPCVYKFRRACTIRSRHFSNIGFIGLGNMGGFMAKNLIKKGYKLTVYDINKVAMNKVVQFGATSAQNIMELSKNSEAIVTMLPMNQHVLDCYTSDGGILRSAKKDTLLVDSSTIDPSVSQTIYTEAKNLGASFIDSPVSGGVFGARDGTLTFMVGGDQLDYEKAKPFLEAMGSRVVHCGDVGMGQVAKICNNMLLAITMIGTSETLNLADRLGLDPKIMTDIINTSTGKCWASEVYNPVPGIISSVPGSNNYEGGFATGLIAKDLGLAQAAATRTESPILLGSLCHQIYKTLMAHGLAGKDFSVIYQFLKGNKGLSK